MALVRLLCFPSASHLPTQHSTLFFPATPLSSLRKPPQFVNSLCPPLSPLSHTLPVRNQKPNRFIFNITSSSQAEATVETPEFAKSDAASEEVEEDEASRARLLAQNVPWTSTVDDIRPLFEKYGTVVDIELSMHNKTRNRGLAFVTMGSPEEARTALDNLEAYEFEGRPLRLNWARPRKKKPSPMQPKPKPIHNFFVANLSYEARAKDLKDFFNAENGSVVSAEIIFQDNPRRSAGYGFVSFNSKEEAEAALTAFQGKIFMGRPIRIARSRRRVGQDSNVTIKQSSKSEQEHEAEELNPSIEETAEADKI